MFEDKFWDQKKTFYIELTNDMLHLFQPDAKVTRKAPNRNNVVFVCLNIQCRAQLMANFPS
jgi:hypothetical protein